MPRRKTAAANYRGITVRFPPELYDLVEAQAKQEDRSLNEQIRYIVRAWATEQQKGKPRARSRKPRDD